MARQRLDTKQAAEALGVSMDAVRKRASRGLLESEKGADGKLYIWLDTDTPDQDTDGRDLLIEFLREQLDRAEARDRENRRIIAALTQRIPPQLEAPEDPLTGPRESPETATQGGEGVEVPLQERRSWWRRFFFGPKG